MKHPLTNFSLQSRLLIYFGLVTILPIILIGVIAYSILYNVLKERSIQFSTQMINQLVTETNNLIADADKVAAMIADDNLIQKTLRQPLDRNIALRYSNDLMIDTHLAYIQSSFRNEFFGFYVIGANGGKYKSNFYSIKKNSLKKTDWYREITVRREPVWFSTHSGSFTVETISELLVSLGYPIIDKATGKIAGVVIIDIESELLAKLTGTRLGKLGYTYLLNEKNQILAHHDPEMIFKKIPLGKIPDREVNSKSLNFTIHLSGQKNNVIYQKLSIPGWKCVGILSTRALTRDSSIMGLIIIGFLIFISILAVFATWTVAGSVVTPLKRMMHLMKQVEAGDLSVTMKVKYNDELGQLGHSFNLMIEEIKNLMSKVHEEHQAMRKAELKALQAQINPHFLYNTLDSIIWLSRAGRSQDVQTMVTALTKLFRIGLSRGKEIITIGEELEHVRSYLLIQQIRYQSKLSFQINLPENLANFQTLKLILQPLVENAIYHGIKLQKNPGMINIRVFAVANDLIFEIEDTGRGMTPEELIALENTLENRPGTKLESYGVKNVNERLKIYFGNDYGVSFSSILGIGTKVNVKIPQLVEVDNSDQSNIN